MNISAARMAPTDHTLPLNAELEAAASRVKAAQAALTQAVGAAKARPADRGLQARVVSAKKHLQEASAAYQRILVKVPAYERPDEDVGWSFLKALSELRSVNVDIGRLRVGLAKARKKHGAGSPQAAAIQKRLQHLLNVERPKEAADFNMSLPKNRLFASPGEDRGQSADRAELEFKQAHDLRNHLSARLKDLRSDPRALPEQIRTVLRQQAAADKHLSAELNDTLIQQGVRL